MNPWQRDVTEWAREIHNRKIPDHLIVPDAATIELCQSLIHEEATETVDALFALRVGEKVSIAEVADGLVDTIWVCLYTAALGGIDLQPFWEEVSRANWAKRGGGNRDDGKLQKPAGWVGPNHMPAIERQMRGEYPR